MRLIALLANLGTLFLVTPALAADEDEAKWDVTRIAGESREIPIRVENGTWLSLDVSPDGERFLVVQNVGGSTEALTIVENWFAEFDEFVVQLSDKREEIDCATAGDIVAVATQRRSEVVYDDHQHVGNCRRLRSAAV